MSHILHVMLSNAWSSMTFLLNVILKNNLLGRNHYTGDNITWTTIVEDPFPDNLSLDSKKLTTNEGHSYEYTCTLWLDKLVTSTSDRNDF